MEKEYLQKQLKHIEGLLNLLENGQTLEIKMKEGKLEFVMSEDFI